MSRPEKNLQFLLLILLYIYKANFNPDIYFSVIFILVNVLFLFFYLRAIVASVLAVCICSGNQGN